MTLSLRGGWGHSVKPTDITVTAAGAARAPVSVPTEADHGPHWASARSVVKTEMRLRDWLSAPGGNNDHSNN